MSLFQRCDWQVGLRLRKPKDDSARSPNDNSISGAHPLHLTDYTIIFPQSLPLLGVVHCVSYNMLLDLLSLTVCLKEIAKRLWQKLIGQSKASHTLQRDWGGLS